MANNKIQLKSGEVLMDLSGDTVTPETLLAGTTAHNAAGEPITGTAESGSDVSLGLSGASAGQSPVV